MSTPDAWVKYAAAALEREQRRDPIPRALWRTAPNQMATPEDIEAALARLRADPTLTRFTERGISWSLEPKP